MINSKHGFCLWATSRLHSAVLHVVFGGAATRRCPPFFFLSLLLRLRRVLCCCSPAPLKSSVEVDSLAPERAKTSLVVFPLLRHARPRMTRAKTRFRKTSERNDLRPAPKEHYENSLLDRNNNCDLNVFTSRQVLTSHGLMLVRDSLS